MKFLLWRNCGGVTCLMNQMTSGGACMQIKGGLISTLLVDSIVNKCLPSATSVMPVGTGTLARGLFYSIYLL